MSAPLLLPSVKHALVARILAVAVAATTIAEAHAAPKAKPTVADDDAAKLKKEGDRAMLDLRYEDALKAWEASYAIDPNPALHYNRGRALEALGRNAEALSAYEAFAKEAPPELLAKVPQLKEHIAEVRNRVTELTLVIPVKGARVVLRNVVLGTAPFGAPLRVNAGKAKLEVDAEGYERWAKEIELPGGGALTIDVALVPKATASTLLRVKSDPPATVSIDGEGYGTTPIEATVDAGSHTVTLAREGYATRTTTVVVASGEHKDVSFGLEREAGLTSKWWFWTGVGVVVVGATAATIGLLTERDAGRGDIAPGRVTAPLISF